MVAVISNGTAVLGLGNIGALASKPVMEGKAVLFKKFAKVNSIDIEVNTTDKGKSSFKYCYFTTNRTRVTFDILSVFDVKQTMFLRKILNS